MEADWASLQNDLLYEIGKHITLIKNYDSFGAVCRSWRAAAPRDKQHLRLKTFETVLLMLPQKELSMLTKLWGYWRGESPTDMREFLIVSTGKIRKIFLPEATKKYCLSWKDWLFLYEEDGTHTKLVHLVSRVQIQLPDLNLNDTPHRLLNVILTANPNSTSDYTVIILLKCHLYFYKLGNKAWTPIEIDGYNQGIILMVYQKKHLYTYDRECGIIRWDVNGPNLAKPPYQMYGHIPPQPPVILVYQPIQDIPGLVEFSNKLYFVIKYSTFIDSPLSDNRRTDRILVYEGIINDNKLSWTEIQDLGNKAIFLELRSSFMVECDNINNYKPNCIYFTNADGQYHVSNRNDGQDMGIFHLSDRSVEAFIDGKIEWSKFLDTKWIGPSF